MPLLVDTVAARERAIHKARPEEDAAGAMKFRAENVIDMIGCDDELRGMPPKCAGVV